MVPPDHKLTAGVSCALSTGTSRCQRKIGSQEPISKHSLGISFRGAFSFIEQQLITHS